MTIISSDKTKVLLTSDLDLKQTNNSVIYTLDDEFNVTTALNSDKSHITGS